MRALILVDLQYDFMPGGALAVPRGDETIAIANRLLPHFSLVAATQDWHPRDHKSFAANHPGRQPYEMIDLHGILQVLWPVHCVQNTHGAELHAGIDRSRVTEVFHKGTDPELDSYSGFFDNDKRKATGLGEWLRERWISRVYVMGLATDYCVKATALDARGLGFDVWLIEDGCRGVELKPGDADRAINEMRGAGVAVVESGSIGP
ncbi:MAG TPA: bifunctional nicotinamidase/pyrazinamidase [Kofleriaceae bacterium]|nr:bifunctional nicotinamidase/pyrazinamidase [Kofleriaceae bacterium]